MDAHTTDRLDRLAHFSRENAGSQKMIEAATFVRAKVAV
jgi:hypothetical protein